MSFGRSVNLLHLCPMTTPYALRLPGLMTQMQLLLAGALIGLFLLIAARVEAQPEVCDSSICSCAALSDAACPAGMDSICKAATHVSAVASNWPHDVWQAMSRVTSCEAALVLPSLATPPDFPPPRFALFGRILA